MKKLMKVSLVAMLVASPMVASAATAPVNYTDGQAVTKPTVTAVGDVASTSYVKGAYNELVEAINGLDSDKQDNLMNNAASPAAISSTVKTSVGATGSAVDTALVTEKAVRDAIDASSAGSIGDLSTLAGDFGTGDTGNTAPATVVAALDGLDDRVDSLETTVGTTALDNTGNLAATTVTAAINELETEKLQASLADVASAGTYIAAGTGVAANLGALDTQVKANADDIADIIDGTTAVAYDNTTSGLTATDVQAAIDEIAATANDAQTAQEVEDAIDAAAGAGIATDGSGKLSVDLTSNGGLELSGSGDAQTVGVKVDGTHVIKDSTTGAVTLSSTDIDNLTAASTALQAADITTGSAAGTIAVDGTDVTVKDGLTTSSYVTVHTTWGNDATTDTAQVLTNTAHGS